MKYESLILQKRARQVCLYVAVATVKMKSKEFVIFLIEDTEQTFSCMRFFAAKCD